MTDDFNKRRQAELDKKWIIVKSHYEKAYKVKFKHRLKDEQIDELYKQLERLESTMFWMKAPADRL